MAKSNVERQREYRERKKMEDPNCLKKEKLRARRYRKPVSDTKQEHAKRLDMNKIYCRKYRVKKALHNTAVPQDQGVLANFQKTKSENNLEISNLSPMPSTSGTVQTRSSGEKLQCAFHFAHEHHRDRGNQKLKQWRRHGKKC